MRSDDRPGLADLEARATALELDDRLEEARDALDAALRLDPASQSCAEARARIALQLKEAGAAAHCQRALAFHGDHPERQLRMIETAAVELGEAAIPLFEDYVARHPTSVAAHEYLAELKAQAGAGERCVDGYVDALRGHPECKPLWMSYWTNLSRSGRLEDTIESMDSQDGRFGDDREFVLLQVHVANQGGLTERAGRLLERLDSRPDADLARGQHRLQTGRPDEAARLLEGVAGAQPDNQMGWALLELAWRITGNPAHEWLVGQPGLYGASELDLSADQLAGVAAMLRSLHHGGSQPLGQSVRGGTQTRGELFMRPEPGMRLLTAALTTAIGAFLGGLPPVDRRHPLLGHLGRELAFGPSWSVRLSGGGYHAAHFHPGGIISSACYISLPDETQDELERPGWLELGRPPPELGLDLAPLATFQPKPGRLVLFPSFLFHGTRPFAGGERLTVAFDLVPAA
jgi:tetratricopeptide (TPR) repeat protein